MCNSLDLSVERMLENRIQHLNKYIIFFEGQQFYFLADSLRQERTDEEKRLKDYQTKGLNS